MDLAISNLIITLSIWLIVFTILIKITWSKQDDAIMQKLKEIESRMPRTLTNMI